MNIYYSSVLMAIFANVAYHVCMKFTHPGVHPLASLAVSYAAALVMCLAVLPLVSTGGFLTQFHGVNWASVGLGIAVVVLEVGFLLAYRAGWNISLAAVFVNVAVGILLVPVGLLWFQEKLSTSHVTGLVLAIVGIVLLGRR